MIPRRVADRLSYANVIATLFAFVPAEPLQATERPEERTAPRVSFR